MERCLPTPFFPFARKYEDFLKLQWTTLFSIKDRRAEKRAIEFTLLIKADKIK